MAVVVLASVQAMASELAWEILPLRTPRQMDAGIQGGEGFQYVHALAFAPSDPEVAYLGVDTSQVWKSVDGGRSWKSVRSGFNAHGARSLLVDPANADVVLAAGFSGKSLEDAARFPDRDQGVYLTEDGGESWQMVHRTGFFKQASKGELFAAVPGTVEIGRTRVFYAASLSEGLLVSEDFGHSWRAAGLADKRILDIALDPADPERLLAATETGLFSFEKGKELHLGAGLPDYPRSIAVSPAAPKRVYAAVGKAGFFVSSDGGATFDKAGFGLALHLDYSDVAVSPVDGDLVYLKAQRSGLPPFVSRDGGKSFSPPRETNADGLAQATDFFFSCPFAVHPTDPEVALSAANGQGSVMRTEDGGRSWKFSGNGFTGGRVRKMVFADAGTIFFCLTDHGVWRTTDNGRSFVPLEVKRILGQQSSDAGDVSGEAMFFSLGRWREKGLIASFDSGASFVRPLDDTGDFGFIAFHPRDSKVIYAGSMRSDDGGLSWKSLGRDILALDPFQPDTLYSLAGKPKARLLVSRDRGESWSDYSQPLPVRAGMVNQIAPDPFTPGRLLLATSAGVVVAEPARARLVAAGNGLAPDRFGLTNVLCLAADPLRRGVFYAGRSAPGLGPSNGVFISTDGGINWRRADNGLGGGLTVWSLSVSPFDGAVYAGTSLGTFRAAQSGLAANHVMAREK